jgi:hypothetical protein
MLKDKGQGGHITIAILIQQQSNRGLPKTAQALGPKS